MFKLSRKLRLALEAVVQIAHQGGDAPVQSRALTNDHGIPHRYLEQAMQRLVHAGILRGVRGPRGGYLLARERRRITIGEIARVIRALEGAEGEDSNQGQSDLSIKVLAPFWSEVEESMMVRLDAVTIEDLCGRAEAAGIGANDGRHADFTI